MLNRKLLNNRWKHKYYRNTLLGLLLFREIRYQLNFQLTNKLSNKKNTKKNQEKGQKKKKNQEISKQRVVEQHLLQCINQCVWLSKKGQAHFSEVSKIVQAICFRVQPQHFLLLPLLNRLILRRPLLQWLPPVLAE